MGVAMSTAVLELPGLVDPSVPTRDEVQAAMVDALASGRSAGLPAALLNAPTGFGKTKITTDYVRRGIDEWDGRFLFVVHRKELLRQSAGAFHAAKIPYEVEWRDSRATRSGRSLMGRVPVVIASKDTLQGDRLASFPADAFTDIIFDEAHLRRAKTWENIDRHFAGARYRIGPTASPWRLDGQSLWETSDAPFHVPGVRPPHAHERLKDGEAGVPRSFAYRYTLPQAIENRHLAKLHNVTCQASIDLAGIRVTAGTKDFNRGDLDDRIGAMVNPLTNAMIEDLDRLNIRRALLFAPDVRSAIAFADVLHGKGIAARAVWGGSKTHPMSDQARDHAIREYREGDLRVLCSCDILTTGFDDPPTQAIVMARPTKSLALAYQMVGRGTRLCRETGKDTCYVLGFQWEGAKGVVSTLDFYLEDEPSPRVRDLAHKLQRAAKKDTDPKTLLDEAREIVEREDKAKLRIKPKLAKTDFKRVEWTPFGKATATLLGIGTLKRPDPSHREKAEPIAPGRKSFLEGYGLKQVDGLPDATAARLADAAIDRVFRGLCSAAEVNDLVRRGVPRDRAETMPRREAEPILRRPLPVSEKMHRWLKAQGFPEDRIVRMTPDEARRHFLQITRPRRA